MYYLRNFRLESSSAIGSQLLGIVDPTRQTVCSHPNCLTYKEPPPCSTRSLLLTSFAALTALIAVTSAAVVSAEDPPKKPTSVLDFHMKDIDGKDVDLAKYHGKVLLIVNTASQCGLTPQYKDLEAIYEKYKDQGFEILAFPANEFGSQEPGDNSQIKEFCSTKYKVSFPLFSKISSTTGRARSPPALPIPDQ